MEKLTNEKVVIAFLNGRRAESHTGALWSTGDRLISYGTIIAQWDDSTLLVNTRGYTATTRGKHQSQLKRHLDRFKVRYINDVNYGERYLDNTLSVSLDKVNDKYWLR